MAKAVQGATTSYYYYDAEGRRSRRVVGSQETWQVYGFEGELVAEYAVSGAFNGGNPPAAGTPTKEYGYRNGQLLVTVPCDGVIKWLVADHLGTPRMEADGSGSLGSMKRHDYLPYGEEVFAGTGLRTTTLSYPTAAGQDCVRQQFGTKERDNETGLDYFGARYFSPAEGRFTSVDRVMISSSRLIDPQQLNRYSYVRNNPLKYVDPDGNDLKLNPKLKKADQDRIIKDAIKLYRKASGRAALEQLEKSDVTYVVGSGKLPTDINLFKGTVSEHYGLTAAEQLRGIKDPKTGQVTFIERKGVVINITLDFGKRDDAQSAATAGSRPEPPSEQAVFNHEVGHSVDKDNDLVKEANESDADAEKNANGFNDKVMKEKDTLSYEEAEKRVREIFDLPPKEEKKKKKDEE